MTAKDLWPTPLKHQVIKEIVTDSPSKRKHALEAKVDQVRQLFTKRPRSQNQRQSSPQQDPATLPSEPDSHRTTLSPLPSLSPDPRTTPSMSPPAESSPPKSALPSDSQFDGRSSLGIRSDPMGGGVDDEESDGGYPKNSGPMILNAGSLMKFMGRSEEENMSSGRVRFTMKDRAPEEKARWNLTHNVVKLEFIHTGPPPPAEERDNRLTDDEELRRLIAQRYKDIFGEEALDLNRREIEGVSLCFLII
jgi:hypothetical protein